MTRGGKVRGQGTIEFIILFGAILMFFVSFVGVVQMNISEKNSGKQRILIENIAMNVRDEIGFAAESSDGYAREFYVPQNVLGRDYLINITEGYLYSKMGGYSFTYRVVNVTGQPQKGTNYIRKENGEIYLNS